ncbi:MAG: rhomboid family intramembrane serine protease, partial [Bacteroidota bacterium]
NMKAGQIPLTFILVALLYVGREVMAVLENDNISQFAHIIGGICGAAFGFALGTKSNTEREENMTGGIKL